jgi:hypothetical protein
VRVERIAVGLATALVGFGIARAAAAPAEPEPPASLAWRRVADLPRVEGATALAVDAATGEVAVADASGVLRVRSGGRPERILRRSEVRDLAYLEGGDLLAATAHGLYHIEVSGRVRHVSPGPGAERRPLRVSAARGLILLGTEGGAFWSVDARRWWPVSNLASGPVAAAAIRADARGPEGYLLVRGELYRVAVERRGHELAVSSARRVAIPRSPRGEPVDLIAGIAGADLALLFPDALALRDASDGRWRLVRPALPPGAVAVRAAEGFGRLWLATDRGLLEAADLEGPWRRVALPTGSQDVGALLGTGDSLYAVVGGSLFAAAPARRAAPIATPAEPPADPPIATPAEPPADPPIATPAEPPADPPIERIHRVALDYLDLGPARIGEMRRGVRLRGWLPRVVLAGVASRDRDEGTDVDEAVASGSFYRLVDQDEGRARDAALSLAFTWELGELLYHPEQIDILREAREVIELRDDVLDEITQLYFERSRVLAELASAQAPEEAQRLRLRAAELAAGIDAWTGGWFSRALRETGS